jgi:hypothetical protein
LLNFEDIDPVRQAGIAREALGYGKTALPGSPESSGKPLTRAC